MNAADDVEIPVAVADAIASWRRVFARRRGADPRDLLRKAAADLWGILEVDRTVHPDSHNVARLEVIDALQEMAEAGGIDPDDAQLIFAACFKPRADNEKANERADEKANEQRSPAAELISRMAADIAPERITWLWAGRVARGKHTCIAGEPGTGKSQLSIAVTGAITTGGEWPCGEGRAPLGNIIILSAEDGAADTIVPRLLAVGADLKRICIVSAVANPDGKGQRTFNLQTDIQLLERKIAELGGAALVIIDPVSSYLGKTDSHKNSEVRGVPEPLGEMAERNRVAVLSITHFNKTGANHATKAMHRFIGSIAFTGAPRAAFAVIEDADSKGRMLFLHAKNNLAAAPQGLAYRLEQTIVADGIVASRLAWESEPVSITANQALAAEAAGSDKSARQEAEEFLRGALANGPVPAKDVQSMASEHGISPKTIRAARESMGVKVSRDGFGPGSKSLWSDPYLPKTSIDAQKNNWASMGPEGKYGEANGFDHPGSDHNPGANSTGRGCEDAGLGDDLSIPDFLRRVP